jgi:hypothetical protein
VRVVPEIFVMIVLAWMPVPETDIPTAIEERLAPTLVTWLLLKLVVPVVGRGIPGI